MKSDRPDDRDLSSKGRCAEKISRGDLSLLLHESTPCIHFARSLWTRKGYGTFSSSTFSLLLGATTLAKATKKAVKKTAKKATKATKKASKKK